jgi:hypothetical protein
MGFNSAFKGLMRLLLVFVAVNFVAGELQGTLILVY